MSWTDERIERLKTLWGQGMTASQIAEELTGVSRNAVIGKAHRLGLEARPSPVRGGESVETSVPAPAPAVEIAAEPKVEALERPVQPAPAPAPVPPPSISPTPATPAPTMMRSIGPGGFERQNPSEQQPPATPAPPRRLVPAKPSADMAGKTSLLDLNDKICKWPLGHPGEPDFHFCGDKVNPGFPYCVAHCSVAYQAQLPRRDRRPPPPLPFGGPRVR
ncbi:GcrA family cell cycle regulator [Sphingomonas sp. ID0503]|uniref:GcrA family cell cycle regulator n=1 Tax=Sphingomonas sp. ID0503 TaxID=3399691 RepID=UPI003AFB43BF